MPGVKEPGAGPGTLYEIELGDGTFGYAVERHDAVTAFVDARTEARGLTETVEKADILFEAKVDMSLYSTWSRVGSLGANDPRVTRQVEFCRISRGPPERCLRVVSDGTRSDMVIPAKECLRLEPDAVWSREDVEQRLLDSLNGTQNSDLAFLRSEVVSFMEREDPPV